MARTACTQREGEHTRFTSIGEPIGNKCLLWHGSRMSNFVGILSSGLRWVQRWSRGTRAPALWPLDAWPWVGVWCTNRVSPPPPTPTPTRGWRCSVFLYCCCGGHVLLVQHRAARGSRHRLHVRQGESGLSGRSHVAWHGWPLRVVAHFLNAAHRSLPHARGFVVVQGVYFADAVSKSANYCFTNRDKNTGLMLLCEVGVLPVVTALVAERMRRVAGVRKHALSRWFLPVRWRWARSESCTTRTTTRTACPRATPAPRSGSAVVRCLCLTDPPPCNDPPVRRK
jgi:hypothetical protein